MLPPLRSALIGLLTAICLVVSACGSDDPGATDAPTTPESSATQPTEESTPTDQPSATTTPQGTSGTTIDITFEGDTVDPNGVERKVKAGKAFSLHIVADKPGELHIHSSPEQELEYPAGTSDHRLTIDQPGVVEVESHDLDTLIVQLEVR
ncbi:MAG: hypothetical protein ABWX73_11470 [Marmoricola sp.]